MLHCVPREQRPEHRILYTIYNTKYIAYIELMRRCPRKTIVSKTEDVLKIHNLLRYGPD